MTPTTPPNDPTTKTQEYPTTDVYISVGNSDDKLSQGRWAALVGEIDTFLLPFEIKGRWFSPPDTPYQNACWCVAAPTADLSIWRAMFRLIATAYDQDEIVFAVARVEMLTPIRLPHSFTDLRRTLDNLYIYGKSKKKSKK